ncbi:MAG TPA: sensor domain-containing diguanylate cyclase [Steroidobacteraceae bacterium]|nr:sensor domain-containing diguanylate cyclase [Steroidobacteraceae bacterium]
MARRESTRSELPATPEPLAPLQEEIRELRARLHALTGEAATNEVILRKTQERELELLKAESLPVLLRALVTGLAGSYSLDAVTLVLLDPQHEIRHLLIGSGEHLEEFPGVMFVESLTALAPAFVALHRPWLGPYIGSDHQLLFPGGRPLRSIALIPLTRQDRLTGTLNFGSTDEKRFTRHHATDFLAHLGVIAAVCIENTINRARLLRSGMTDFLTGWHNRRYLHTRIKEELARAQRHGSSVACLMIDVDHFKQTNDIHGHLAGDQVLRELAQRIDGQIRGSDTAARFGGDEFAILLPDTGVVEAAHLAERIRQIVCSAPIDLGDSRTLALSLSIGAAAIEPRREERDLKAMADRLLAEADSALYRAKAQGRGRVEASDPVSR